MTETPVTDASALLTGAEKEWREAATAAVFHALLPQAGLGCERYRGGLRTIDVGDGTCGMAWVEGGRAVQFGYVVEDAYTDRILCARPVVDLLAGGPDWLPWEWLYEAMREVGGVSFVLWWDGSAWHQAPLPGGGNDHFPSMIGFNMEDVVFTLADSENEDLDSEEDEFSVCEKLLQAGMEGRIDRAVLEAVVGLLEDPGSADVEAALEEARYLGVAADGDGVPPVIPAGRGEPADRRVHVPLRQGGASVSVAMLGARESERPDPGRGPALEAVLAWWEDNGRGEDVRVVKAGKHWSLRGFPHPESSSGVRRWHRERPDVLLDAWREEEAHPERGRWLCARIRREGGTVVVERAYDRLPTWQGIVTWDETGLAWLREETAARSSRWRPGWASLLEEDFDRDGAPPHLCWRPGLPADSM